MLSRPVSYRDLYLFATGIALFGFVSTTVLFPSPISFWFATLYPLSFVTVHLVRLPTEYTEESLCSIPTRLYSLFAAISVSVISIGVFAGYGGRYTAALLSVSVLTIGFFYLFCGRVESAYTTIEFGFREKLPNNRLWKSATVFLSLHQNAFNNYTRVIWRQFALGRFAELSQQESTTYSNTEIAQRYERALHETPIGAAVSDTVLSNILDEFTQQPCSQCGRRTAVSDMYFITNNGEVNHAYCFPCLDDITPGDTNYASERQHEQHQQETTETEITDSDIQFALDVFDFESVDAITAEELRSRYRTKVQETHPDSGGSADEFKLVKEAHTKLQSVVSSSAEESSAP